MSDTAAASPLSSEAIVAERLRFPPRWHAVAQAPDLPFCFESPRQFELLAHALLQAEGLRSGSHDLVQILPEGADQGVDVRFYGKDDLRGVVQCKRYSGAIQPSTVLVELFKYLRFAQLADDLPAAGAEYQFWTAHGASRSAATFFADPRKALTELSDAAFEDILHKVSRQAKALEAAPSKAEETELRATARQLKIRHVGPAELTQRLAAEPNVRRMFFRLPEDSSPEPDETTVDRQIHARRTEQLKVEAKTGRVASPRYAPRAALTEDFERFLVGQECVFVLSGGSGQGKSTWSVRLLDAPPPAFTVDVLAADEIGPDDSDVVATFARILSQRSDALGSLEATRRALWRWLDSGNRLLIVDGLDRVSEMMRPHLRRWIQNSIRLSTQRTTRLVLTSRPETWRALGARVEADIEGEIFTTGQPDAGTIVGPSHHLGRLDEDEARALYGLYDLPPDLHRARPLATPGLIRQYARLRGQLGDKPVSRRQVMAAYAAEACGEVADLGVGRASAEAFLARFGTASRQHVDGRVPRDEAITLTADAERTLNAFLQTDLLTLIDGAVRGEPDDTIEYLGALGLDLDTALQHFLGRAEDSLFVGTLSMALSGLETTDPAKARQYLTDLLSPAALPDAPLEAAARVIAEIQDHGPFEAPIQRLLEHVSSRPHLQFLDHIGELLSDLRLPTLRRLELLMMLEGQEEPDDWRTKYWTDPQAAGQWRTRFARAATSAVRRDPEAAIPWLMARLDTPDARFDILQGLVLDAAEISPRRALEAAWPHRKGVFSSLHRTLAYLHPVVAAEHVCDIVEARGASDLEAAELLWGLSGHHYERGENPGPVTTSLARAAERLAPLARAPRTRALLAVTKACVTALSPQEQDELVRCWADVDVHDVWSIVLACPNHEDQLLDRILGEVAQGGEHERALIYLPARPWPSLVRKFEAHLEAASDAAAAQITDAVEKLLYVEEGAVEPNQALRALAERLSGSAIAKVRKPLIYYAGTPRRTTRAGLAFRDALFQRLIDHEDGETLDPLVWKIFQSGADHARAARRLADLCGRFSVDAIEAHFDVRVRLTPHRRAVLDALASLLREEA